MICTTTETISGHTIASYCGVYTYSDYNCSPYGAIDGLKEQFREDYSYYDDDQLALIGIRLTQLTDY